MKRKVDGWPPPDGRPFTERLPEFQAAYQRMLKDPIAFDESPYETVEEAMAAMDEAIALMKQILEREVRAEAKP